MKSDRAVMEDAISILEKEGAWCQLQLHRTAEGYETVGTETDAVSHCATGAVWTASGYYHAPLAEQPGYGLQVFRLIDAMSDRIGRPVVIFNDDPRTSQSDVVLMMKRTLEDLSD